MKDYNKYFEENTVTDNQIKSNLRKRKSQFLTESIHPKLEEDYTNDGWELDKRFKTSMKVKKKKSQDLLFEDRVWCTLAILGFTCMNKNRNFKIPYDNSAGTKQQVDVFAADDETILVIECKSTAGDPKKGNFKETIEAIGGKNGSINLFFII